MTKCVASKEKLYGITRKIIIDKAGSMTFGGKTGCITIGEIDQLTAELICELDKEFKFVTEKVEQTNE